MPDEVLAAVRHGCKARAFPVVTTPIALPDELRLRISFHRSSRDGTRSAVLSSSIANGTSFLIENHLCSKDEARDDLGGRGIGWALAPVRPWY
jgi:hypothetical protein